MGFASFRRAGCLLIIPLALSLIVIMCLVNQDLTHLSNQVKLSPGFDLVSQHFRSSSPKKNFFHRAQVLYSQDGHFYFKDELEYDSSSKLSSHPILTLIRNATTSWKSKISRQSKDLGAAVKEYKRRNGRDPPIGFDKWWQWSRDHNVKLLDEYDSMHRDLEPFHALEPQTFKKRVSELVDQKTKWKRFIFVLSVKSGKITVHSTRASGPRAREISELLRGISHLLPEVDIPISDEDVPVIPISSDTRELHVQAARRSQFLSDSDSEKVYAHPGLHGWPNTCRPSSKLRQILDGIDKPSQSDYSQSFIYDHLPAMDICMHPELSQQNGFLSSSHPRVHPFYPLFSFTKYHGFSDINFTPTSQYFIKTEADPDWNLKKPILNWRGSSTGIVFDSSNNWRQSQRSRLVKFCNVARGKLKVRKASSTGSLETFEADTRHLNEKYFDVGFSGRSSQCDKADGTCEAISNIYTFKKPQRESQTNNYKYVIDVDGNGWSGRFHRLMSTKSAILKSTIFPEWYVDRIQPWVHYIPVRVDYQDLYDIMAFFLGDLDGKNHNDQIGEKIGKAGSDWAEEYWRIEDMQAYMYLLILEYARLLNRTTKNPKSMDYVHRR